MNTLRSLSVRYQGVRDHSAGRTAFVSVTVLATPPKLPELPKAYRAPRVLFPGERSHQVLVVAGDLLVHCRWTTVMWLAASVWLSGKAIPDTEIPAITPDGARVAFSSSPRK